MLVPKRLWTLPGSTTSCLQPRKAGHFPKAGAVPSVFSFRPPMSPKWEYEARRRIERKRDVCPRRRLCDKWWGHSLSEAGRKRGEEVTTQAKFVPGGFFMCFFFQVALGRAPGLYTQSVCEVKIERYLAFKKLGFLERQSTVSSFSFQVLFQTSDNPTWVSRIQTRRISLTTVTETPEVYAVCTVGGDDVCTLTVQETRLSWRSAVAYFSSKVL